RTDLDWRSNGSNDGNGGDAIAAKFSEKPGAFSQVSDADALGGSDTFILFIVSEPPAFESFSHTKCAFIHNFELLFSEFQKMVCPRNIFLDHAFNHFNFSIPVNPKPYEIRSSSFSGKQLRPRHDSRIARCDAT